MNIVPPQKQNYNADFQLPTAEHIAHDKRQSNREYADENPNRDGRQNYRIECRRPITASTPALAIGGVNLCLGALGGGDGNASAQTGPTPLPQLALRAMPGLAQPVRRAQPKKAYELGSKLCDKCHHHGALHAGAGNARQHGITRWRGK